MHHPSIAEPLDTPPVVLEPRPRGHLGYLELFVFLGQLRRYLVEHIENAPLIQPLGVFPNVLSVVGDELTLDIQRALKGTPLYILPHHSRHPAQDAEIQEQRIAEGAFRDESQGDQQQQLGAPPYGYRSDPQDKDHWILDEDTAPVVKRIFDMTIDGVGPSRIVRILEADGMLTVKALYAKQKGKPLPERPHHWIEQSVVNILERMEYTGRTCNFKTYSKSYKLKKCIPTAPEDMFILADTQEAIVPQAQWNRVQELRKNKRRVTKGERQGLFSGLAFCADCGSKLHFGTCSAHYIREEVLRDVVLGDLSRERYQKMSEGYEAEQERLKLEIAVTEEWVERREEMDSNLDRFFALTEKYVDILKLTPTIVNEFIKKIIVCAPDKSSGKRTQEIRIIFNFLDGVDLPEVNGPILVE
ncbi:MAG: DUF4368 domain-containing protein [Oscillospiraceae bacterium]|nr:DUF4368 domain-containing protein [Oscillospiraceae bacterium]